METPKTAEETLRTCGIHTEWNKNKLFNNIVLAMKQYAEEMVKHNLKIAAENVELDDDWIFDGEDERYTIYGINKNSITNIKIELL